MITRFALATAGLMLFATVLPVRAQTSPSASTLAMAARPAPEAAGPGQLFPPLPPLASLPPSVAQQLEEATPAGSERKPGRKTHRGAPRKAAEASVRIVVSDESLAYLAAVDRKLDEALRSASRNPHGAPGAVSVALSR